MNPIHSIYNPPKAKVELLFGEFLISKGADLNAVNKGGFTPLAFAFKHGCRHLEKTLQPQDVKKEEPKEEEKKGPEDIF